MIMYVGYADVIAHSEHQGLVVITVSSCRETAQQITEDYCAHENSTEQRQEYYETLYPKVVPVTMADPMPQS
jgi:hypothetical protein